MLTSDDFKLSSEKEAPFEDDSPKMNDILSKHKANLMRYAQKFNLQLNNEPTS